uniref:Usp34 protein n=21 Tax=Amniota TaxID=32524 RepID=Q05C12_MOUSE|nr:Usp34 protein [Mus musculus]
MIALVALLVEQSRSER